jgi:NADH-quinone oxidoreductase subunit G
MEGRVQRSERAVFPPGDAREDWTIFRALSEKLGKTLQFDTIEELRADMGRDVPALAQEGLATFEWNPPALNETAEGTIDAYPIKDFYLTNAICRASPTMRRCSEELVQGREYLEAAE